MNEAQEISRLDALALEQPLCCQRVKTFESFVEHGRVKIEQHIELHMTNSQHQGKKRTKHEQLSDLINPTDRSAVRLACGSYPEVKVWSIVLWLVKKRAKKGAVNSPALSECNRLILGDSPMGKPSD